MLTVAGCTADQGQDPIGTTTSAPAATTALALPSIKGVEIAADQVGNFELWEMGVELSAEYDNPFDQREVALDAVFVGPDGAEMEVPGFWDGREQWKVRFTPSQVGP